VLVLAAFFLLECGALPVHAQSWVEVKSPNFTVLSNAGERRARDVAWQFEQIRLVLTRLWPWAKTDLGRPVTVYAARDERSMRQLVPEYWEQRGGVRPASVLVSAPDGHYIALRADLEVDTRGETDGNPYRSSYWSYAGLVLSASFGRELPPWFFRGMAELFSNTVIRGDDILVGFLMPDHVRLLRERPVVPLDVQLKVQEGSPYLTRDDEAEIFDASTWALLHYLSLGNESRNLTSFNTFATAVLKGTAPDEALAAAYGGLPSVDEGFRLYLREFAFVYYRVGIEASVDRRAFTSAAVAEPSASLARARLHAAMNRPVEARAELAAARGGGAALVPMTSEIEGLLLDREGKREEAVAAYRQAADGSGAGFFGLYRLAALTWPSGPALPVAFAEAERHLRRSVELNGAFAPAQALLAVALAEGGKGEEALPFAQKSVALDASSASSRLALARVLWQLSRSDEARAAALAARALATTDEDRRAAQQIIDTITARLEQAAPSAAAASAPAAAATLAQGGGVPGGVPAAGTAPAVSPPTASEMEALNAGCQRREPDACVRILTLAEPVCANGVMAACGIVAWIRQHGIGVPKDPAAALQLFEKACDGGDGQSCAGAAVIYASGDGVPADLPRAAALLDKGCAAGSAQACEMQKQLPRQ
jgi:TPR repeat protein